REGCHPSEPMSRSIPGRQSESVYNWATFGRKDELPSPGRIQMQESICAVIVFPLLSNFCLCGTFSCSCFLKNLRCFSILYYCLTYFRRAFITESGNETSDSVITGYPLFM